jgi:D-alanyl-D-alanine carboxypeptidase
MAQALAEECPREKNSVAKMNKKDSALGLKEGFFKPKRSR